MMNGNFCETWKETGTSILTSSDSSDSSDSDASTESSEEESV